MANEQVQPANQGPNPWNGECELCYGKHKFKVGDPFFHVIHPFDPKHPINICQICWFRWANEDGVKPIAYYRFDPPHHHKIGDLPR